MLTWKDVIVAEQSRKDTVARAKQLTKRSNALKKARAKASLYARSLYLLGRQLVAVGCRLQQRYQQAYSAR